ncbi:MAG TPA: hypothetical protein VGE00_02970, partial [Gammaproteobacteria bacterium]
MELTVTQHYESRLGPFETISVEVLNDRYGRITTSRRRKSRNYAIELATLDPEPRHTMKIAWKCLAAGLVSLLALAGFIYYLMNASAELPLAASLGGGAGLLALTLLFVRMFAALTARHIIFHARYSTTPLMEIP